jgi:hypothetical protein
MRFHEIIAEAEAPTDPLEIALDLWVEGKMRRAETLLLGMDDAARPYRGGVPDRLYRGFLPTAIQWDAFRATKQFSIHTDPSMPFASWSASPKAVKDFMIGWERPWMMLMKPSAELNIFINLVQYAAIAKPRTQMVRQKEVIIRMPPAMQIMRQNVRSVHKDGGTAFNRDRMVVQHRQRA